MASDLGFGGGPLLRQRPILGCNANEEEDVTNTAKTALESYLDHNLFIGSFSQIKIQLCHVGRISI